MLPNEAFHVTLLSEVVPATVAANDSLPLMRDEAEEGEMVTELTAGSGGGGAGAVAVVTVTVAEADMLESALLVAVILADPAVAGAV